MHAAGRLQEAISVYSTLVEPLKGKGHAWFLRGQAAFELGQLEDAEADFRAQLSIDPDHTLSVEYLGDTLRNLGRLNEAFEMYERLIGLSPEDPNAYFRAALARKTTTEDAFFQRLERFVANAPQTPASAAAGFGLSKALGDLGRDQEQLQALHVANKRFRSGFAFNLEQVEHQFSQIKSVFNADAMAKASRGECVENPVFVVGLPRSGSTLTESVLTAMPGIAPGGEMEALPQTLASYERAGGRPDQLPSTTLRNRNTLAQIYLNTVRQRLPGAERFTDKMLGNFALIGVLHLLLPEAKIVNMQRNRLDMAWSIYANHFLGALHHYAYDLEELGGYVALYEDLMRHWSKILPGYVHTVPYEALVGDADGETRRLADFVDLPWSPKCLEFHALARPQWTRSSDQVRDPIHMRAVGRGQARANDLSAFSQGYERWRERLYKQR